MIVLVTAAFVLVTHEYFGVRPILERRNARLPIPYDLFQRWAVLAAAAYIVVPALIVLLVFRERLSDFGVTLKGVLRHLPLYLLFYLCMVPVIWFASRQPAFQEVYPFTPEARKGLVEFLKWEAVYGLQFLGLEFFFRGFLIFGLKPRFGINAVLVMIVPYCMIHFHKPMLESIAAIGAGAVLGILAYRTRCIVGGVLIHFAVAVTMDLLAIQVAGGFLN